MRLVYPWGVYEANYCALIVSLLLRGCMTATLAKNEFFSLTEGLLEGTLALNWALNSRLSLLSLPDTIPVERSFYSEEFLNCARPVRDLAVLSAII